MRRACPHRPASTAGQTSSCRCTAQRWVSLAGTGNGGLGVLGAAGGFGSGGVGSSGSLRGGGGGQVRCEWVRAVPRGGLAAASVAGVLLWVHSRPPWPCVRCPAGSCAGAHPSSPHPGPHLHPITHPCHSPRPGNLVFLPKGAIYVDVVPELNEDKHTWAFFLGKDLSPLLVGDRRGGQAAQWVGLWEWVGLLRGLLWPTEMHAPTHMLSASCVHAVCSADQPGGAQAPAGGADGVHRHIHARMEKPDRGRAVRRRGRAEGGGGGGGAEWQAGRCCWLDLGGWLWLGPCGWGSLGGRLGRDVAHRRPAPHALMGACTGASKGEQGRGWACVRGISLAPHPLTATHGTIRREMIVKEHKCPDDPSMHQFCTVEWWVWRCVVACV